MAEYDYETMCQAVEDVVRSETAALVESGRADVEMRPWDAGTAMVTPRNPAACAVSVNTQSDDEVSLGLTAPGTDRTLIMDIFDGDSDAVLAGLREYLATIYAGRIQLTLARESSAGRCRLLLSDGIERTHHYNVFFGFLVGRGSRWETFRPESY